MEIDYSKGKIYKIYIPGLEELAYIGSTVIELYQRLKAHKHSANSDAQYKFASCVFFQEGNEPIIELIENYPCETKAQLLERERYWLDKYPEAINKIKPLLGEEERVIRANEVSLRCYYNNREHNIAKHKEWIDANKEQQAEYKRNKRLEMTEEERKAKDKADYDKRKEITLAKKKEKIECPECKKVMNKNSLWEHKKTKHTPVDGRTHTEPPRES